MYLTMNKTFILTITMLAAIIGVATAPTIDNAFSQQIKPDKPGKPDKPDKPQKPQKCQVKVQLKVLNAINGTIYTAQLGNLQAQSKLADESTIAFNFQFKKGGDACPVKGESVIGNVNGLEFSSLINSLTKPNKVVVELDAPVPTQ
jgi:TolA-binding protein